MGLALNKFSTIRGMNKTWSFVKEGNQILLYAILFLALSNAALVYKVVNRDESTVFVPPGIGEKTSINKSNADSVYLQSIGVYVTTLIGNLTPNNIQFVLEALSPIMSPESYALIRKQLISLSKDASFRNWVGSTHFEPTGVMYEADTKKVFVSGNMTDVNTTGRQTKTQITYEMKVVIVNRWPQISNLVSYAGNEPKTLKWLELHPENVETKE